MPLRRSAYVSLMLVLALLVVIPAIVDAGGNGPAAARGTDASSAEDPGAPGGPTATPGVQAPASVSGPVEARGPVAVTASPMRPAATATISATMTVHESSGSQQTAGITGGGKQTGSAKSPQAQPTALPSAAGSATVGGDGRRTMDGGNAPPSGQAPMPVMTTAAGSSPGRPGADDTGRGNPVDGTVTATPTSGMGAPNTSKGSPARAGPAPTAIGPGAPGAAPTASTAGLDTRGAAIGSPPAGGNGAGSTPSGPGEGRTENAGEPGAGSSSDRGAGGSLPAATGDGVTVRPTAEGTGHGATTVTYAAGNGSGVQAHRTESPGSRGTGGPAGRDETAPTVRPSSEGIHAFRVGAGPESARAPRPGGAGQDGTHGGPRPQNAGRERGPPDPPAAAPVRTGLEPVDRSKDESGRGRRGVPAFPLPVASEVDTPDPLLFLRFLLFLGYRRLRPGNLLDHPLRQSLYAAIRADPGLDLAGCVAATAANRETLRYHLALLVCGGKVLEETRNGSVRYFPHDLALSPLRRAVIHLDRSPGLAPALHHIRDTPGIPRRELAARLGIAGPTVTRQVQRLVDEGLVENRGSGLSQGYWLTPECSDAFGAIAEAERNRVVRGVDAVTA